MRLSPRAARLAVALVVTLAALCAVTPAAAQQLPASCAFGEPIVAGVTVVKAAHLQELRACVNALRGQRGLSLVPWTDPVISPQVSVIRAVHLVELREALHAVYSAAGAAAPQYSDGLTPTVTFIRALHVNELRAASLAAPAPAPAPPPCSDAVSPMNPTVGSGNGSITFSVATSSDCSWQAQSTSNFLHIAGAAGGTGSGSVAYTVENNTASEPRHATLLIAGRTIEVTQSPVDSQGDGSEPGDPIGEPDQCSVEVSIGSFSGQSGAFTIIPSSGCGWVADSVDWVHLDVAAGTGTSVVEFTIDELLRPAGTLSISTATFIQTSSTAELSAPLLFCDNPENPLCLPIRFIPIPIPGGGGGGWTREGQDNARVSIIEASRSSDKLRVNLTASTPTPGTLIITLWGGPGGIKTFDFPGHVPGSYTYSMNRLIQDTGGGQPTMVRAIWRGARGERAITGSTLCVPSVRPGESGRKQIIYRYSNDPRWTGFNSVVENAVSEWNNFAWQYGPDTAILPEALSRPANVTLDLDDDLEDNGLTGALSISFNPRIFGESYDFAKSVVLHELGHARGYRNADATCNRTDTIMYPNSDPGIPGVHYTPSFGPGDRAAAIRDIQGQP